MSLGQARGEAVDRAGWRRRPIHTGSMSCYTYGYVY